MIDPTVLRRLTVFDGIPADAMRGGPSPELVAAFQKFSAPLEGDQEFPATTCDVEIQGPYGPIRCRTYRPVTGEQSRVGLVWAHGGGFVGGALDDPETDGIGRELAARAGATVIAVEYRLARDGVCFPVPHDDLHAAFLWACDAADELGVDRGSIAIAGASAGGNLAAGVALRLVHEGGPAPHLVLLVYPTLHSGLPDARLPADMHLIPPVLRFTAAGMAEMNANYAGGDLANPYAFPGEANLRGFPRTLVVTCEYDELRGSADRFVACARAAGVDVRERLERGVLHAHLHMLGLPARESTLRFILDQLAA